MADRFIPKDEYIFREGESAEFAYVLKSGSVEILKSSLDGDIVLAKMSKPSSLFGEMALIDGAPRSAGARAAADTTVTEVQQSDFLKYVQQKCSSAAVLLD